MHADDDLAYEFFASRAGEPNGFPPRTLNPSNRRPSGMPRSSTGRACPQGGERGPGTSSSRAALLTFLPYKQVRPWHIVLDEKWGVKFDSTRGNPVPSSKLTCANAVVSLQHISTTSTARAVQGAPIPSRTYAHKDFANCAAYDANKHAEDYALSRWLRSSRQ